MTEQDAPPLAPPRARLAEAVASFGAAAYRDRGARFLARASDDMQPLSFDNIRRMPLWWKAPEADRASIGTIAALINYRTQIDRELDGGRLRALVGTTGETLFDIACTSQTNFKPVAETAEQPLPIGDDVERAGMEILHRALPSAFSSTVPQACGDRDALEIADEAANLWQQYQQLEGNDGIASDSAAMSSGAGEATL